MNTELYVFIDNSFMYIQGYKYVERAKKLPPNRKPQFNYLKFQKWLSPQGNIKRIVLVGSQLSGNMIANCQQNGFEVITLPRFPNTRTGKLKEKGVDQKLCWEIAKTIFTNKEPTSNKKIVLCTGDKDFASIFSDIQTSSWALDVIVWENAVSKAYIRQAEVFGKVQIIGKEWQNFIDIVDKKK